MGGKSGGGSVSTAGLEKATADATALQKQIHEEGRQDIQPWYQMGVGGVNKLSDLLGISGGSMQTREQMRAELMPEYTTQQTTQTGAPESKWFVKPDGTMTQQSRDPNTLVPYEAMQPTATPVTTDVTDYAGLNTALDERMAGQGTPEGFGSLLERFDEQKMKDSAGYQFRQEQGNKALERQMAAQGVTLGGGGVGEINPTAYKAMQEYNQGLASQEYQNEYNRYVGDQLNTFNMLMGASGSGQKATNQMIAQGQKYGENVGHLQTGLAQAQYEAQQANASKPSMFGTLLGGGVGAFFGGPQGAMAGANIGGSLF